jgi:hypothetical protein
MQPSFGSVERVLAASTPTDSHAGGSARISFRREAFTFLEVGKALATSGASTTTFAPVA